MKMRKIWYRVVNELNELVRNFYKFSTMLKFLRKVGCIDNYPFKFKKGICYTGMIYKTKTSFNVKF